MDGKCTLICILQEKKSIGRVNTCKEIIENKTTSTWISSFPCFLKLTAMRTLWNHDYRVNDVKCYHKFFNKPKSYIEDTSLPFFKMSKREATNYW